MQFYTNRRSNGADRPRSPSSPSKRFQPAYQPNVDSSGNTWAVDSSGNAVAVASKQPDNKPVVDSSGNARAVDSSGNALPAKTDVTNLQNLSALANLFIAR